MALKLTLGTAISEGCRTAVRVAPAALVLVLLGFCRAGAASPQGAVLAQLGDIEAEGLLSKIFVLPEPATVWIEAEGLADSKGTTFLSQGWILDLTTRKPVWTMTSSGGSWDRKTENWRIEEEANLRAGTYAVYFAAVGGRFPLDKAIRLLGVPLGRIEGNWGPVIDWDEKGTPERWGIRVQAMSAGTLTGPLPPAMPEPYPDAEIRLLGLTRQNLKRVRIDLDRPVEFEVRMTGEYSSQAKGFADGAWLTERTRWHRVWTPDKSTTAPAGGDEKNRAFSGTIRLPRGSFLLTAATDNSHAPGSWNSPPPWDPQAWGVVLWQSDPNDASAVHLTPDDGLPQPALAISRAEDDTFVRKPFSVTRPALVLIRCSGESSSKREFADYGWIESLGDLEPAWEADPTQVYWAGGAKKNWIAEDVVELPRGQYALCYGTDDSHAFGDWNAEPPWEPDAWGISIAPMETDGVSIVPGNPPDAPSVISLAPVRSDEELVKRFDITESTRVLLVALGEGSGGEMADYGWLKNESTGRKVWTFGYEDSEPAGGAKKNRMVRVTLELSRGEYSLHYVTDGSHAFGDWNDTPPRQPHLWGVTLIEKP